MPQDSDPMLTVSAGPHIRYRDSVRSTMVCVVIALLPALATSVYVFGTRALLVAAVSVAAAVVTESVAAFLMHRPQSAGDFSAVVTGLLLAFCLPPGVAWWIPALGAAFAVGVAKMAFGGLGQNFMNPALAGRAFLMASYPTAMTTFALPAGRLGQAARGIDAVSAATPLALFRDTMGSTSQALDFQEALGNLFLGNVAGCLGETSALALLVGAGFLWYRLMLGFKVPFTYVATVFTLFWLFSGTGNPFTTDAFTVAVYQVLSGGLILGALFMASDVVTSPITPRGKILFGFGCGVLTYVFRAYGGYPEGVCYAILLMNCVSPLIDRYTRPRRYGEVRKRA